MTPSVNVAAAMIAVTMAITACDAKAPDEAQAPRTQTVAHGPRDPIIYNDANSVRVFRSYAVMGGFRFRGQYTKGFAPAFRMPSEKIASVLTGLGAEHAVKTENWYAIFAVANDGDGEAAIKLMPFLRVGAPSGDVVPLVGAGEGVHDFRRTTSYLWSAKNNLANVEALIISENGGYSGRVTRITANSERQVTLADIGNLVAGDFLLPAPPGYSHFVYLGSFYFDTAEVRNIYDSGTVVKARMINLRLPDVSSGEVPPPGKIMDSAGYIAPLATAVFLESTAGLSTASTGDFVEYYDGDGASHVLDTRLFEKTSNTTSTYVFGGITLPFSYYQRFNYYNGGDLASTRVAGKLQITGWVEP